MTVGDGDTVSVLIVANVHVNGIEHSSPPVLLRQPVLVGLPVNVAQRSDPNVFAEMGDHYMPRFLRMFELFMVAFAAHLFPAFSFEFFDELFAVHNMFCTHKNTRIQAKKSPMANTRQAIAQERTVEPGKPDIELYGKAQDLRQLARWRPESRSACQRRAHGLKETPLSQK